MAVRACQTPPSSLDFEAAYCRACVSAGHCPQRNQPRRTSKIRKLGLSCKSCSLPTTKIGNKAVLASYEQKQSARYIPCSHQYRVAPGVVPAVAHHRAPFHYPLHL